MKRKQLAVFRPQHPATVLRFEKCKKRLFGDLCCDVAVQPGEGKRIADPETSRAIIQRRSTMIELFDVHTIAKELDGHSNVRLSWFRLENMNTQAAIYAEVIRDYNPDHEFAAYAEFAVEELFARDEAETLKAYLDEHHGGAGTTEITKHELPISNNVLGFGAIPTSGGPGRYCLWQERCYSLPFKVVGFFDLRNHKRLDGRENIAHLSSQMVITPEDEDIVSVGKAVERLLAQNPTWSSEQALTEFEKQINPPLLH
jgi:hypothetical protein